MVALGLTAGLGTRLQPHTFNRAKPAIPLLGRTLLDHSVRHLVDLPIQRWFFNLHYRPDDIKVAVAKSGLGDVQFSDETQIILGSGGAVAKAWKFFEPFESLVVFNSDEVFVPHDPDTFTKWHKHHLSSNNAATLLVMKHPEVGHSMGGVWTDDSMVKMFSKKPVEGRTGYHYVGYLLLQPHLKKYFSFPPMEENILYDCLTRAIQANEKIGIFETTGDWFEVGNTEGFLKTSEALTDNILSASSDRSYYLLNQFLKARKYSFEQIIEKERPSLIEKVQKLKLNF